MWHLCRDFQRCTFFARLMNFRDNKSSWKQSAEAEAIANTPQSVPFDCCATGGMVTSMESLFSTKRRAAICSCVKPDMPLKRLSYSLI